MYIIELLPGVAVLLIYYFPEWKVLTDIGHKNIMFLLNNRIFLDSSMVEHSAVNRVVVGSSPTRGVYK